MGNGMIKRIKTVLINRTKIVVIVVALAVIGLVVSGYTNKKDEAQAIKRPSFANQAIPVVVVKAQRGDLELTIIATGDVAAKNEVKVYSKVEGRIIELPVDSGDRVKRGQFLAKVEDDTLKAIVAEATASLEVARARWAQMEAGLRPQELEQARDGVQKAEAESKNAELTLKRAEELYEKKFFSVQQLDDARLRLTSAKTLLNSAKEKLKMAEEGYRTEDRQASLAQLHQAEANLRMAEIKLAESRITAPIEGIISERMVDEGAFVHVSTGILGIVDMESVKVLVNVSEKDIPHISSGRSAKIVVDAYAGEVFTGRVKKISPVVDRESRTAEVEILVPNKELKLKPGMFARVEMVVDRREDTILVPIDALLSSNGQDYLFVHQNGKALKRTVTIGMKGEDRVEVVENLAEGEEVIVAGMGKLRDNSPIRVVSGKGSK